MPHSPRSWLAGAAMVAVLAGAVRAAASPSFAGGKAGVAAPAPRFVGTPAGYSFAITRGVAVWLQYLPSWDDVHVYCVVLRQRSLASGRLIGNHPIWCSDLEASPNVAVSAHRALWITSQAGNVDIGGQIATASLDGGKATNIGGHSWEYPRSYDCGRPEESVECELPGPDIAADTGTLVYDLKGVLYRYSRSGAMQLYAAPRDTWPERIAVAAGRVILNEDGRIEVRALADGSLLYAIDEPRNADIAVFATSKYLVVQKHGPVELRDLASGELVKTVTLPRGTELTTDATRIAYITPAGQISIYDPAAGTTQPVAQDKGASHPVLDGRDLGWLDADPPVIKAMSGV